MLRGSRTLCFGIGLLCFLALAYMHQRPIQCPTPLSRLDLLHSLVAGKVSIDAYHENTSDKAEYKGHFYSDKAPGTVVLAMPAFVLSVIALRVGGVDLDSESGWLFSSWMACVGSIGIIAALGAGLLFIWLSKQVEAKPALVTVLALFLGAAPLPYATMMFSHALVVGLIAIALWAVAKQGGQITKRPNAAELPCIQRAEERSAEFSRRDFDSWHWLSANRWDLLAGCACGWALASEYTAGIIVVGFFFWLISQGRQRAIPFCLAAVPPLLLIPLYSWACFGNPFILPYSLNTSFPAMKQGLYAIKWPNPETAYNLLFSPTRGLFFWTPFLFMAGCGYWRLMHSNRRLFWLTYAVPLLQIIVISGRTWDWPAGPTLGPRYLAPMLPLLALPCAFGVQRFPRTGMLLAVYSILITTLATLTNASPRFDFYNPLTELHIPLLLQGEFEPNLGQSLGLPPYASVALFYAVLICGIAWLWRQLPKPENPAAAQNLSQAPGSFAPNKTGETANKY